MTETQVGFLYKIAAAISRFENDTTKTLLKSYYLMRCKDITRGYGLPDKHFSPKIRCPNCCVEWKKNTEIKIQSIKLSKRQKKRLKSRKIKESKKERVRSRHHLIHSNEIAQICTFCKQSTTKPFLKPEKQDAKPISSAQDSTKTVENKSLINNLRKPDTKNNNKQTNPVKKKEINVYANALDVFSMQNKNNDLVTKEQPKVINNNKRKKDKFAGLCQKAVLASGKLKKKEEKQSKLSLFLKPSS